MLRPRRQAFSRPALVLLAVALLLLSAQQPRFSFPTASAPTFGLAAPAAAPSQQPAHIKRRPQPPLRKPRPVYHDIIPTPPFAVEHSLRLVSADAAPAEVYSDSHCFSDNLQPDAWRARSCLMTNVCFDLDRKHFVYHARANDPGPGNMSMGVFNQKWGVQYDSTVNFSPVVRRQALPTPRLDALEDEIYMAILPFAPSNIGHLIWDDFLAAFLSVLHVLPHPSPSKWKFRPIWFNAPHDPPWATCDWTRLHEGPGHSLGAGFSLRCDTNIVRWLPLLVGPGNTKLIETHTWFANDSARLAARHVCFPRISFGPSSMSNQGTGLHGWNPSDMLPPAAGRGPLFWEFRVLMMRHARVQDLAPGSLSEIKVLFADKASNRVHVNFDKHRAALDAMKVELEAVVSEVAGRRITVRVQSLNLARLSAKEQIEAVRSAAVYVTVAGGGSFSAQFLPRGAAIVLYHEIPRRDNHMGFVDYKFWNFVGWLRPTFIDTGRSYDMQLFARVVREEVILCASFLDVVARPSKPRPSAAA